MFQLIDEGVNPITSKLLSLHPERNSLYRLRHFNPFQNPSCRMHSTDHGIFVKIFGLVLELARTSKQITELDKR